MKTYAAGAYTTSAVSTDLGASDDIAINISTRCVRDDCEVSILKVHANGDAVWET